MILKTSPFSIQDKKRRDIDNFTNENKIILNLKHNKDDSCRNDNTGNK